MNWTHSNMELFKMTKPAIFDKYEAAAWRVYHPLKRGTPGLAKCYWCTMVLLTVLYPWRTRGDGEQRINKGNRSHGRSATESLPPRPRSTPHPNRRGCRYLKHTYKGLLSFKFLIFYSGLTVLYLERNQEILLHTVRRFID
jgi:hypothetical protein